MIDEMQIAVAIQDLALRTGQTMPKDADKLRDLVVDDCRRLSFSSQEVADAVIAFSDGNLNVKPENVRISARLIQQIVRRYREVRGQNKSQEPIIDGPAVETEQDRQYLELVLNEDIAAVRSQGVVSRELQVRWGWVIAKRFALDSGPYMQRARDEARKVEIWGKIDHVNLGRIKDSWNQEIDKLDKHRRGAVFALADRMCTVAWMLEQTGYVKFPN